MQGVQKNEILLLEAETGSGLMLSLKTLAFSIDSALFVGVVLVRRDLLTFGIWLLRKAGSRIEKS